MSALRIIAKCMEPVFCINFHGLMLEKNWKLSQVLRKKRPEDAQNQAELNTSHFFKFCHKINGHPYGTDFTFFCETMFGKLMKIAEKKLPKNPWSTSKGYWKPVRTEGTKLGSRWALVLWHPSSIQPGILKALGQGVSSKTRCDLLPRSLGNKSDIYTYMPVNYQVPSKKLESRWGIYPPGAQKNAILVAPLLCQALKWERDWHGAAHVHVMTSRFWPSRDVFLKQKSVFTAWWIKAAIEPAPSSPNPLTYK